MGSIGYSQQTGRTYRRDRSGRIYWVNRQGVRIYPRNRATAIRYDIEYRRQNSGNTQGQGKAWTTPAGQGRVWTPGRLLANAYYYTPKRMAFREAWRRTAEFRQHARQQYSAAPAKISSNYNQAKAIQQAKEANRRERYNIPDSWRMPRWNPKWGEKPGTDPRWEPRF